eukprot:g692.t1
MPSQPQPVSTTTSSSNPPSALRSSSYSIFANRPDAPDGFKELCILKSKVTDDERFLSAQNGLVLFGRRPPDADDIEHERRILYIPTGEGNRKLSIKDLSDMILSSIYHTHVHGQDGENDEVPKFKFNSRIAGLWYEPLIDGKAAFVPLASIADNPSFWCLADRDYYVLNPDVMEDELTAIALEVWKNRIFQFFSCQAFLHLFIWLTYDFVAGLVFITAMIIFVSYFWYYNTIQLPNGVDLREKLIDEGFFVFDYIVDPNIIIQCTVISIGYFYMAGMHFQVFGVIIGGFHSVAWTIVRHFYRWRWGLQRLEYRYFETIVTRLSQVCEDLT